MSNFWSGGYWAHYSALRKQLKEKSRPLKERLALEADPIVRGQIKRELQALKEDFGRQEKASRGFLFGRL